MPWLAWHLGEKKQGLHRALASSPYSVEPSLRELNCGKENILFRVSWALSFVKPLFPFWVLFTIPVGGSTMWSMGYLPPRVTVNVA